MPKKRTVKKKTETPTAYPGEYESVFASDLEIERIQRQVSLIASRYMIDLKAFSSAELRAIQDKATERMILELRAKVASKKFDVKTVRYPSTWRDAVKQAAMSWAQKHGLHRTAAFILNRLKINFTEVTMEANAYHPSIAIPDHDAFVEILVNARRDAWK